MFYSVPQEVKNNFI